MLRATEEWSYVEREVDVRLERKAGCGLISSRPPELRAMRA